MAGFCRHGSGRVRSRDRIRAAGCGRRAAMALPGRPHRRNLRPLRGLAVASFDMFIGGLFSSRPEDPFRADAQALAALTPEELAAGFQVGPDNPLVGLEGRTALLNRLGQVVAGAEDVFGREDEPRPGGLFDVIVATAEGTEIKAIAILDLV